MSRRKSIAIRKLHQLEEWLDHERAGLINRDLRLDELWAFHEHELLARLRAHDLAPSTFRRARDSWAAFERWRVQMAPHVRRVRELTSYLLRQYQLTRAAHVRSRTVNTELVLIGSAFRAAVRDHRIEASPFSALKPLKELDSTAPVKLIPDQVAELISKADSDLQPYLIGAAYTGARRGELRALAWSDVDLERCVCGHHAAEHGRGPCREKDCRCSLFWGTLELQNIKTRRTSRDRTRLVPIHPRLQLVLEARRHLPGGPWRDVPIETIRRKLRVAVRAAGLPPATTLHSLRHAFAGEQINRGVATEMTQALLGHRDPKQTRDYSRLQLEPLRKAMEGMKLG